MRLGFLTIACRPYMIKVRHTNDHIYANFNGFFYIIRKHLINEQSVN